MFRSDLVTLLRCLSNFIRETSLPKPEDGLEWNETYGLIEDYLTTLTNITTNEPAVSIPELIAAVAAPAVFGYEEIITDLTTELKALKDINEDLSLTLEASSTNLAVTQSQLEPVQAELEIRLQYSTVTAADIQILFEYLVDWEVAFNKSQDEVTHLSLIDWEYQYRVE